MFVLLNTRCNNGRGLRRWEESRGELEAGPLGRDYRLAQDSDDLAARLRNEYARGERVFVAAGGDGTVNFLLNAILNADGVEVTRPIASGLAEMVPVVQKELGLKDEDSARKLFYSNTFDFTGMGNQLIKHLLKELQSSIGFYEVQTGQSIAHVLCSQLPANLGWLGKTIAGALGVSTFQMELIPWLASLNIKLADGAQPDPFDERWLGLCALMASYNNAVAPAVPDKKS